jgi:hypothetical protein
VCVHVIADPQCGIIQFTIRMEISASHEHMSEDLHFATVAAVMRGRKTKHKK